MANQHDTSEGNHSMARIRIRVVRLPHAQGLDLPAYQTTGAAGMDLIAAVGEGRLIVIAPGKWALIPTGLVLELPKGVEAQVRPRSGLALRHGVTVLNSPGTIDSDYRGEVGVLLINFGSSKFKVERGARIAQLVVQKVEQASLAEVTSASATHRGTAGFGSTGVRAAAKQNAAKAVRKQGKKIAHKPAAAANKPGKPLQRAAPAAGKRPASGHKRAFLREKPALLPANPLNARRLNVHRRPPAPVRTPPA